MKAELEVGVNAMDLAPQVAISRELSAFSGRYNYTSQQ
jgi:hypothetical protein